MVVIKVEDKLPNNGDFVVAMTDMGWLFHAQYKNDKFYLMRVDPVGKCYLDDDSMSDSIVGWISAPVYEEDALNK